MWTTTNTVLRLKPSEIGSTPGSEAGNQPTPYEEGPGKNLPFSVDNKWRLLAMMCVFFGSGFGAPFFIVRHQLLKK
uniref:Cytochrome c oxidase subunit 7C, mitochondrial n=1 Tax=Taeniopygia guttata TaxID=59729 RepID=H0Z8V3_TAEGU